MWIDEYFFRIHKKGFLRYILKKAFRLFFFVYADRRFAVGFG